MSDGARAELHTLLGEGGPDALGTALAAESSPTVLRTDRWTKRLGQRLAAEWSDAGVDGVAADDANLAADAIETLLASSPTLHEHPEDIKRARWWTQLMASPETVALRSRTVLNTAVAEIAAATIASKYAAYAEATKDREDKDPEHESPREAMERIRSIRDALGEASEAADDAEACGAGLGITGDSTIGAQQIAAFTRRLRKSPNLARIMRMAGRFAARAQQLQRQRTDLPGMEITGVELSGDLTRVLPYESALIAGAVPELELLAMARLAQRRSLSYRRILRTPVGMGPLVISLDESGSNAGSKIETAKGLALAMVANARAQRRPFMLVAFTGSDVIRIAENTPEGIVSWCEAFLGGGSDCDLPLSSVPPHWPTGPVGKQADHIIIGDAEVTGASVDYVNTYIAWATANRVRTYSIVVGPRSPGVLATVSDGGCWCIPTLDLDNPAVETILSIGPSLMETR
jgi:uncharacterized protein with von Willebrand factor type A (vWA) domain